MKHKERTENGGRRLEIKQESTLNAISGLDFSKKIVLRTDGADDQFLSFIFHYFLSLFSSPYIADDCSN